MKDYDGDLVSWATDVQHALTEEHKKNVEKVKLKKKSGCAACRMTTCKTCWWPKTVRYWRRVETAGKFSDVEGYDRVVKLPTAMEL